MMKSRRDWGGQGDQEEEHAMLLQGSQGYHHGASRQVLLEDITVVIDAALIAVFCVAVHLLRRRAISVATLAHLLSVPFLVVVLGHSIERHVLGVGRVGELVRRRPGQGGVVDWFSAGILSAVVVTALVARFWNCRGASVDCVVGNTAPIHYRCKIMRLRFFFPVFAATMAFVYVCISARLNALLGGSVLHPEGGGYALAVLASPTLVSALFVSGSVSVWLYSILVDAQDTSCLTLQSRGADGIPGEGRCYVLRGKRSGGGGTSNAWEAGSSSSSRSSSGGRRSRGGGGIGGGRGAKTTPFRAGGAGAGKFVGGETAGPAHALDPPFFPLSPYNLVGKEARRPSSSLVQAARGGLPIQRLGASDVTDPARDSARGVALGQTGGAVRGPAASSKWLPPPGRKTGNRSDPQLATASVGEGLLQAASGKNNRASDTFSSWGNVSSLGGDETCRSAQGLTTATRSLPQDSPYCRAGFGPAGASRFSLEGVASARDGTATVGTALLPVPPVQTPHGRNKFPDGQAWRGGEAGGAERQQQQQLQQWGQQRRRPRTGGGGRKSRAMTGSAHGWTSSSCSSSSSDSGSSDEDFAGSGGGEGRGSGRGIRIRRLSGLSSSLSAAPSTRLSLGAPSYASHGGRNLVVPPFPSSGVPVEGGGASLAEDDEGWRSFDRGLRSREVLLGSPMGKPKSSVASMTSRRSRSSSSGSSGSERLCSRDIEGLRGGGGDMGATSGNRWASGDPPREKRAQTTTAFSAAGYGGGGGSGVDGDWGSAFSGNPGTGDAATRLRRREGWIV